MVAETVAIGVFQAIEDAIAIRIWVATVIVEGETDRRTGIVQVVPRACAHEGIGCYLNVVDGHPFLPEVVQQVVVVVRV